MFGLGVQELLIILAIVILIFGPRKLPELGSAIGRTIKGFRRGMKEADLDDAPTREEHPVARKPD
jgi:sec-independent protein translocase protein TatA